MLRTLCARVRSEPWQAAPPSVRVALCVRSALAPYTRACHEADRTRAIQLEEIRCQVQGLPPDAREGKQRQLERDAATVWRDAVRIDRHPDVKKWMALLVAQGSYWVLPFSDRAAVRAAVQKVAPRASKDRHLRLMDAAPTPFCVPRAVWQLLHRYGYEDMDDPAVVVRILTGEYHLRPVRMVAFRTPAPTGARLRELQRHLQEAKADLATCVKALEETRALLAGGVPHAPPHLQAMYDALGVGRRTPLCRAETALDALQTPGAPLHRRITVLAQRERVMNPPPVPPAPSQGEGGGGGKGRRRRDGGGGEAPAPAAIVTSLTPAVECLVAYLTPLVPSSRFLSDLSLSELTDIWGARTRVHCLLETLERGYVAALPAARRKRKEQERKFLYPLVDAIMASRAQLEILDRNLARRTPAPTPPPPPLPPPSPSADPPRRPKGTPYAFPRDVATLGDDIPDTLRQAAAEALQTRLLAAMNQGALRECLLQPEALPTFEEYRQRQYECAVRRAYLRAPAPEETWMQALRDSEGGDTSVAGEDLARHVGRLHERGMGAAVAATLQDPAERAAYCAAHHDELTRAYQQCLAEHQARHLRFVPTRDAARLPFLQDLAQRLRTMEDAAFEAAQRTVESGRAARVYLILMSLPMVFVGTGAVAEAAVWTRDALQGNPPAGLAQVQTAYEVVRAAKADSLLSDCAAVEQPWGAEVAVLLWPEATLSSDARGGSLVSLPRGVQNVVTATQMYVVAHIWVRYSVCETPSARIAFPDPRVLPTRRRVRAALAHGAAHPHPLPDAQFTGLPCPTEEEGGEEKVPVRIVRDEDGTFHCVARGGQATPGKKRKRG